MQVFIVLYPLTIIGFDVAEKPHNFKGCQVCRRRFQYEAINHKFRKCGWRMHKMGRHVDQLKKLAIIK